MLIGYRLRALRQEKNLSQGDIQERTGMLRCYIPPVENGHTVPAVETLEKFARALEVPMYQLFYDGEEPPALPAPRKEKELWGERGKDAQTLERLRQALGKVKESDRRLLLSLAQKMARSSAA